MKRRALAAGLLAALALASPAAGAELLHDDFEAQRLWNWSVQTGGEGAAVIETTVVAGAGAGARLSSTSASGSFATLRKRFAAAQSDLTVAADVRVLVEGASGGNVPLFKLFDANGALLVNLYRQNGTAGRLYVKHDGAYHATNGYLPLDSPRRAQLHVSTIEAGGTSVSIDLNGTRVYDATVTDPGAAAVATLQLGNDVKAQTFTIVVDNVSAANASADTSPPETTIADGPTGSVASSAATFELATEPGASFECSSDNGSWTACASPYRLEGLADGEHVFRARAVDAAGNVDPTPAEQSWTVALGDGCDRALPPPATDDPGSVVIADGFEDESLPGWTAVREQGDADVRVQREAVHAGRCAAELDVTTATWDSRANLIKTLPVGADEVWADGWFDIREEGASSSWNTPTFRFLSTGRRILDVSRQNQDGSFFVRFPKPSGGFTIVGTGRRLSLGRWYHVKVHAIARGNLSTVEVWLDGTRVYASNAVTLGVSALEVAMVGAEHQNQEGVVAADDVVVKAITPPSTDVIFDDGFESATFGAWTSAGTGGDGTATIQGDVVHDGSYAATLTATANTGSFANVRKALAQAETDVTATAHVRVLAEGAKGATVPLLTFNDAGGARVASAVRHNQSGDRIGITYGGVTYATTGTLPLDTWAQLTLRTITRGDGTSTVRLSLNGAEIYASDSASLTPAGVKTALVGATGSGKGYTVVVDDVTIRHGSGGPPDDPQQKLLIADYLNKRLLITDFTGRVVWSMDNPTASASYLAGPIGLRWLAGDQILATFGTGDVGVIDVATKTWVWKTKGFNGDAFQSPYDAELLPDGRLAVALRFNAGGRIDVYDLPTGQRVWTQALSNAHSVHFRTAAQSYNSADPTLLIAGFGKIREVAYRPGEANVVTWEVNSEYTHDAIVVEDDRLLTTEGYYVQKIDRSGTQIWKRSTPEEDRRIALNPNPAGGYVLTVGEGDRVELRDKNGNLLREWNRLSDGSVLDYPYGIQVIGYSG